MTINTTPSFAWRSKPTVAIATLTLNPALDLATETERVVPVHKLRCPAPRLDPGGGGINVARVIHTLGGEATAVYPAGGPTGETLTALVAASGIPQRVIPTAGRTRESFTVHERASGEEYRFVLAGPTLSVDEQRRCLEAVAALTPRPVYLVASGSLPPGVDPGFYGQLARQAREHGVKLVLDTSGEALRRASREGPYLLKPNRRELSELVGRELANQAELEAAARQLCEQGQAQVVVVSLAADGALLVTAEGSEQFPALQAPIRSTVGAGDTLVGAVVLALASGWTLRESVRLGMAAAAATLMAPGTGLCRREDVERLYAGMDAADAN